MQINRINANQPSFGACIYSTYASRALVDHLYRDLHSDMIKKLPEQGIKIEELSEREAKELAQKIKKLCKQGVKELLAPIHQRFKPKQDTVKITDFYKNIMDNGSCENEVQGFVHSDGGKGVEFKFCFTNLKNFKENLAKSFDKIKETFDANRREISGCNRLARNEIEDLFKP